MTPAPRQPKSSQRPPRRVELLKAAGLLWAEPARQREFWTRRAAVRPLRARNAGEIARGLIGERQVRSARRLGAVQALWEEIVPGEWVERARPVALRGGRLTIAVRDAAARFLLERELGPAFLSALRARGELSAIHTLDWRLAALSGAD